MQFLVEYHSDLNGGLAEAWMTAEDVAAYFNGSIKVELFEAVAETIKVHDCDPAAHALLLTAYIQRAEMGAKSGVATLDEAGKVPAGQLPSYVDDVVEFPTVSSFPQPGEGGLISTQGGNTVVTDSNGRCIGMAATATPTITIQQHLQTLARDFRL